MVATSPFNVQHYSSTTTTCFSPPPLSLPTTTMTPTSTVTAMGTQDACPESPHMFFLLLLTISLCSTGDMVMAWLVLVPTNDTGLGGDPPGHNGVFFFLPFFQTNCIFSSFLAHILHKHHHHNMTPPSPSQQQQDGDDKTRTIEQDQQGGLYSPPPIPGGILRIPQDSQE
jgi:hypothetical protein